MAGVSFTGVSNYVNTTAATATRVFADNGVSGAGETAGIVASGGGYLLLEDGFKLILEDGSGFLLLE